jgi:hypothetical protein
MVWKKGLSRPLITAATLGELPLPDALALPEEELAPQPARASPAATATAATLRLRRDGLVRVGIGSLLVMGRTWDQCGSGH